MGHPKHGRGSRVRSQQAALKWVAENSVGETAEAASLAVGIEPSSTESSRSRATGSAVVGLGGSRIGFDISAEMPTVGEAIAFRPTIERDPDTGVTTFEVLPGITVVGRFSTCAQAARLNDIDPQIQ